MKKLFMLLPLLLFAVIQARAYDEEVTLGAVKTFECTTSDGNGDFGELTMSADLFSDLQEGDEIRLTIVKTGNDDTEEHPVFAKTPWGNPASGVTLLNEINLATGGTSSATFAISAGQAGITSDNINDVISAIKTRGLRIVVRRSSNETTAKLNVTHIKKNRTLTAVAEYETGYIVDRGINYTDAWGGGYGIDASKFCGAVKAGDVIKVDVSSNSSYINLILGQWTENRQTIGINGSSVTGSDGNYSFRSLPLTQAQADIINSYGITVQHSGGFSFNAISVIMKRGLESEGANLFWYSSCYPTGSWSQENGKAIKFDAGIFTESALKSEYGSFANGGLCIYYVGTGDLDWCTFVTGSCGYSTTEWGDTRDKVRCDQLASGVKRAWIQFNSDTKLQQVLSSGVAIVGSREDICIIGAKIDPKNIAPDRGWVDVTALNVYNGSTEITNGGTISLKNTTSTTLTATIAPDNASNKKVKWVSSDENVATVDDNGKIFAKANGTATITVTVWDDHSKTISFTLNVTDTDDFSARKFEVKAPTNSANVAKLPLVISLHGSGWTGSYIDFNSIYEKENFVVVYPEGNFWTSRGTGWNALINQNDDIEFLKYIVDQLKNNPTAYGIKSGTTIDEDRIYICGWSNGGMLAYQALAQMPGYFAAGASSGGFPVNEFHLNTASDRPVPFLHIHGGKDVAVNINEENSGAVYDIWTHLDNMIFRNGSYPKATKTTITDGLEEGTYVDKYVFNPVGDGLAAEFEYHYVSNMGHTQIGEHGYDVPQNMWNFFKEKTANRKPYELRFRAVLKASKYADYLGEGGDNFDVRKHGWTINGKKYDKASKTIVDAGDPLVIAAYGEGASDPYVQNNTINADGTYITLDDGNHDTYPSIQLKGDTEYQLHFNTSSTNGDYVTVQLYRYNPTSRDCYGNILTSEKVALFSEPKRYFADNGLVTVNFTTTADWAEYAIEIKKGKETDESIINFVEILAGTSSTPTGEYFYDPTAVIPDGLQMVRQPIYGRRGDFNEAASGQAREYFVFAKEITRDNGAEIIPRTFEYTSGEGTTENPWKITGNDLQYGTVGAEYQKKEDGSPEATVSPQKTIAHVFGSFEYKATEEDGICWSERGAAGFQEYVNNWPSGTLTRGTFVMKPAGTVDIYLYVKNKSGKGDNNGERRRILVWYMNDYMDKPKVMYTWEIHESERADVYKSGNPLVANVRLEHLGRNGSCYLYYTYEGSNDDHNLADESLWIQGFMIKRPDLKVTIGRTDNTFANAEFSSEANLSDNQKNSYKNNAKCTAYGENEPYVWEFTDARFLGADAKTHDVLEKLNTTDNRCYVNLDLRAAEGTYLEGSGDHLLIYSENSTSFGHFVAEKGGDPAHIQFDTPTQIRYSSYKGATEPGNLDLNSNETGSTFDPIVNDGLKVNVTGSGWFKVCARVPADCNNAKMTVMTSQNGGLAPQSLLRFFRLPNDGKYHDYVCYLRAHDDNLGFSDPNGNQDTYKRIEMTQQSLYLVFENIGDDINTTVPEPVPTDGVWDGDKNGFQVDIQRMEWLNDEVPDYVFQRDQYLFESQTLNDNRGDWWYASKYLRGRQEVKKDNETLIYWQAGGADAKADAVYDFTDNKYVYSLMEGVFNDDVPTDHDIKVVDAAKNPITENTSTMERGRFPYDGKWQMVSGAGNVAENRENWTMAEKGATPHRGVNATTGFGGVWDQAAMPTLGLREFVNSNGKENPNTDGIYNVELNGVKSPLWRGAHTELQFPRIYNYQTNDNGTEINLETGTQYDVNMSTDYLDSEFGLPVSGPFFRFMPMLNTTITMYIVPGNSTGKVFVLDETGHRVEATGTDMYQKIYGSWAQEGGSLSGNTIESAGKTIKLTLNARAGKEYFITSTDMAIGMASMYFDKDESITLFNETGKMGEEDTNQGSYGTPVWAASDDWTGTKYTNVEINRAFDAGKWYSIVLPFSMNEAKVEEFFGEGTKCLHYERIGEEDGHDKIYLLHHRYNMITAGRPIFIRPGKSVISGSVVTNVTLQTNGITPYSDKEGRYSFTGSYNKATMPANSIVLGNKKNGESYIGQLALFTTEKGTQGMRSWIQLNEGKDAFGVGGSSAGGSSALMCYDGSVLENTDEAAATSIVEIISEAFGLPIVGESSQVYDLNGRAVGTGADLDNLPAGVYVVNGKKVVK